MVLNGRPGVVCAGQARFVDEGLDANVPGFGKGHVRQRAGRGRAHQHVMLDVGAVAVLEQQPADAGHALVVIRKG